MKASIVRSLARGASVLASAAVLLVALPSCKSASAGDDEGKAATLSLVRLQTSPEAYSKMVQQMVGNLLASVRAQGKDIAADAEARFEAAIKEALPYDELLSWHVEVYSKRFTASEIHDLLTFYKTPTGQKFIRLMPELAGEAGKKLGSILPRRLPEALKKHGLQP